MILNKKAQEKFLSFIIILTFHVCQVPQGFHIFPGHGIPGLGQYNLHKQYPKFSAKSQAVLKILNIPISYLDILLKLRNNLCRDGRESTSCMVAIKFLLRFNSAKVSMPARFVTFCKKIVVW